MQQVDCATRIRARVGDAKRRDGGGNSNKTVAGHKNSKRSNHLNSDAIEPFQCQIVGHKDVTRKLYGGREVDRVG
jgi:hypothetical protein